MSENCYITDLSAYNQGFLIGEWVELGIDEEELNQIFNKIFRLGEEACGDENHEEYFLTDWDTEFLDVGEYSNVYELNREVARLNELNLDDSQKKCVSFLMSENIVSNLDEAIEKYEDCLIYEDMSFLDLAFELVDEQGILDGLSQFISNYFDYEKFASDLELDNYTAIDGDIFYYPY